MTDDDIIRMAREAGVEPWWNECNASEEGYHTALRNFARLIQGATREECAKVCDELEEHYSDYKDTALLNDDIALSNAYSGWPRACRFLAEHFRSLNTKDQSKC